MSNFSSTVYWREYPFPLAYSCRVSLGLFLGSLFSSVGLCLFWWLLLLCYFKSGSVMSPALFFLKTFLALQDLLWFHTKFRIVLFIWKNSTEILMEIMLNLHWFLPVAQTVKNLPAMWETWVWSLGQEDSLEKGTATHSSILAWEFPWTEEPGGLQSMG